MEKKHPQTNKMLAQYFTPKSVVDLGWELLRRFGVNDFTDLRIIDPAAGAGAWLFPALRSRHRCADSVYAIELDETLKGIGEIRHFGDALWHNFPGIEDSTFDIVVGNPPFGRLSQFFSASEIKKQDFKSAQFELLDKCDKNMQSCPIELLFLERALQLARPGGWVVQILPESFFSNTNHQKVRDWFLTRMDPLCIIRLPNSIFRANRLRVQTCMMLGRRCQMNSRIRCMPVRLITFRNTVSLKKTDEYFKDVLKGANCNVDLFTTPKSSLFGKRWDPRFWSGRDLLERLKCNFELLSLGDYLEHLTYGPIVTGRKVEHVDNGRPIIRQGDIAETGLLRQQLIRVEADGDFDPLRSRVRNGDFLMARSGAGSLGKNRMMVYTGRERANISCFVDLLRIVGINAFFVWFFLKTFFGRSQIFAVANGVGTPNINFSEVRGLLIPSVKHEIQIGLEEKYRTRVLPLHRRKSKVAGFEFSKIITQLERHLAGRIG